MFLCWVALQLWWRCNYSEYGTSCLSGPHCKNSTFINFTDLAFCPNPFSVGEGTVFEMVSPCCNSSLIMFVLAQVITPHGRAGGNVIGAGVHLYDPQKVSRVPLDHLFKHLRYISRQIYRLCSSTTAHSRNVFLVE